MPRGAGWAWREGAVACVLLAAVGCEDARPDGNPAPHDAGEEDAGLRPQAEHCGIEVSRGALENEPLVVPLACASGIELPRDAMEWAELPVGAELDREAGELRWTPALDQAGEYEVALRLPGGERGTIRIAVAERFEDPRNVPIVDPLRYPHEYGLPVFHLRVDPGLNGNAHTPATIVYQGREYTGAGVKYRGSTSASYPKRSFTLKFDKDAPFADAARGFPRARRVVLTTNFDDASGLRQRLAFAIWNRIAAEHIPVQAFNAVVYLDGQYLGLYTATDHVDDDMLRAAGLPDSINMYKARTHSANFKLTDKNGKPKTSLRDGYTKEEGLPEDGAEGAYADLEELVQWFATAPQDEFYAEWENRLARRDFEDWLVYTHLIAAGDTTNKNCYLIHDPRPDAPDARWRFIPWDFNTSFGQGHYTQRLTAETLDLDDSRKRNAWFQRQLSDPRLREPMLARYRDVLRGPWSLDEIIETYDGWAKEIEAAALRDELKWGEAFRAYWAKRGEFNTHREEIAYIRDWLRRRWKFNEANLPAAQ